MNQWNCLLSQSLNVQSVLRLNSCHMWKRTVAVLTSGLYEVAEHRVDWPVAPDPLNSVSWVSLHWPQFLLLGCRPCHGTCSIHHRLLVHVTELRLPVSGKCSAVTVRFYFCLLVHFGHCVRSFLVQYYNDSISIPADIPSVQNISGITFKLFICETVILLNNPVFCLRCLNTCLYPSVSLFKLSPVFSSYRAKTSGCKCTRSWWKSPTSSTRWVEQVPSNSSSPGCLFPLPWFAACGSSILKLNFVMPPLCLEAFVLGLSFPESIFFNFTQTFTWRRGWTDKNVCAQRSNINGTLTSKYIFLCLLSWSCNSSSERNL